MNTGKQIGLKTQATILRYLQDGRVEIALNEANAQETKKKFIVDLKPDWCGPQGQFAGGYPSVGSTISVCQGHGGLWYWDNYLPSGTVLKPTNQSYSLAPNTNLTINFKPNRYLIQTSAENYFYLDQDSGINFGSSKNFFRADPKRETVINYFSSHLEFSSGHYKVSGLVKRDLENNLGRNILSSSYSSLEYQDSLSAIGIDPSLKTNYINSENLIRNLPLTENRTVYYEFGFEWNYSSDQSEISSYQGQQLKQELIKNDRRRNRSISLNLHDQNLNSLIEENKGTLVDAHGNILDLNYSILPLGKEKQFSLLSSDKKDRTFSLLRRELTKSVAFHFEINTRKIESENFVSHNPFNQSIYGREKSRFSFDVNKEGQFKLNIPASSNFGGLPLLSRSEHYNLILSQKYPEFSVHEFFRNPEKQELYLSAASQNLTIPLISSEYESPISSSDYLTSQPIGYGTLYHDITKTCSESQIKANYLAAQRKLVNFNFNNHLNRDFLPKEKIVSEKLYLSGEKSNVGGRSGLINLDGFLNLNLGKNQSDGQSLWFDYQGGVVGNIGRDNQNISYAVSMDGDCYLQVGSSGIEDQTYRNGTLDIKVILNGQPMIFRMGPEGITIVSPGRIVFDSQQDIIFRSNSAIKMHAEIINLYSEQGQNSRNVNRFGGTI